MKLIKQYLLLFFIGGALAGYGCPSDQGICNYHCTHKVTNAAGDRPVRGECQGFMGMRCTCIFGSNNFRELLPHFEFTKIV